MERLTATENQHVNSVCSIIRRHYHRLGDKNSKRSSSRPNFVVVVEVTANLTWTFESYQCGHYIAQRVCATSRQHILIWRFPAGVRKSELVQEPSIDFRDQYILSAP